MIEIKFRMPAYEGVELVIPLHPPLAKGDKMRRFYMDNPSPSFLKRGEGRLLLK
ncbi:MAG: hypothetical protein Q8P40_07135 [Nitrospirota bacterium]|jgi:hypothetical protein|nr:hypothetical protein [Nitrospirota bacterium]